jgi:cytochrome c-type biogenesis protein CcmE
MKSLKKRRRMQVIALAVVALAVATGLIGYGMRDGINFFRSPSQIAAEPPLPTEVFRIGGLVDEGSIIRGQGLTVKFVVSDANASIPVNYTGVLPDLFNENQGMIGTGSYVNGVFEATEILAKHDENYMPAEVVDMLKEQGVYQDPNQGAGIDSGDS